MLRESPTICATLHGCKRCLVTQTSLNIRSLNFTLVMSNLVATKGPVINNEVKPNFVRLSLSPPWSSQNFGKETREDLDEQTRYYQWHPLVIVITSWYHGDQFSNHIISMTNLKLEKLWQVDGDAEYEEEGAADRKAWANLKTYFSGFSFKCLNYIF